MRVESVSAVSGRLRQFRPHPSVVCLVLAAALVTGAIAQDAGSSPTAPPVAPPAPAQVPPGATSAPASSPGSTPSQPASSQPSSSQPSSSSEPSKTDAGVFVFRKEVEEVALRAIVIDQENHLIAGLNRDAFTVYEDGQLQKMTSFREENVPLALGVLIDNSGSMRPKRQKVNDAVLNLIRSSNPGDKVFVVNFGDQPYLDQDFTDDVGQLTSALNKIEARGTTALYDAIVASAAHVKQGVNMQKRVLLVVTDGRDNASQDSLDEAMRQLQRGGNVPVVYVIAFIDDAKGASSTMRALQTITQNTGGAAYFPRDLDEVDAITRSIAHDIRFQYVIGYKSSNPPGPHVYHRIDVQASNAGRQRLRVRTRTGYYSDSQGSQ